MREVTRYKSPGARLKRIAEIIENVDHRAMCAEGPITDTRTEMTADEMRSIYELACGYIERSRKVSR